MVEGLPIEQVNTDQATVESLPTTGVYQSYNGRVLLNGVPIIRISSATFRVTVGAAVYYEVGEREGTPYVGQVRVVGSLTRSYVNTLEWMMALGVAPNATNLSTVPGFGLNPGLQLPDKSSLPDLVAALAALKGIGIDEIWTSGREAGGANTYPLKTNIDFEVNTDGLNSISAAGAVQPGKTMTATILGAIIDTASITMGAAGEIITSGPIDFVAQGVIWEAK